MDPNDPGGFFLDDHSGLDTGSASADRACADATTVGAGCDSRAASTGPAGRSTRPAASSSSASAKKAPRRRVDASSQKRRCISTACIACRRRKSKCDGALPSCAACASVYGTECVYDPNSDHRRKGVYREKADPLKTQSSTLQILIEAILNAAEDDVPTIVRQIRTCDSLDAVAEQIVKRNAEAGGSRDVVSDQEDAELDTGLSEYGERELARKMGELRIENGAVRFIGGTSHLIYLGDPHDDSKHELLLSEQYSPDDDPITTWTGVTSDPKLIMHLMNMYFTYHYAYFTTLSRKLFWRDFTRGRAGLKPGTIYCSSLLVNAMLALGCHFTSVAGAFGTLGDSRTKGDHFFAEAKRLIIENDEYEKPRLVTVQALALMSVREAGCAREAKGWVYSGMSFRMAQDIGLNLELNALDMERMSDEEIDARRITFWGCFLFDKCWSNYLGRLPQIPTSASNVSRIEVFPDEDSSEWRRYTDDGFEEASKQPARTRAVALQLFKLCEISSDLLIFFYHPNHISRSSGKAFELKKLSELHQRLEEWRRDLPNELEATKEGQLPNVILMHMFYHLQYIHLFRPFLKYAPTASPLSSNVSPRRICTANASAISKLMRLYKKSWSLRQICNIAVYMIHSACTIHLLNLPEKTARRDITHGIKELEEIAEDWLCARRTLSILSVLARKWRCKLPDDATAVLTRTDGKYGDYSTSDVPTPQSSNTASPRASETAAAAKTQRDETPMSQYVQAHFANPPRPASMMHRMAANPSLQAMSSTPIHPQQAHITQAMPPGMEFGLDPLTGWPPAQTTDARSSSYSGVMSLHPTGSTVSAPDRTLPTAPPVQVPGIDGRDWFFNDSARWQQSFAGWDTPRGGATSLQRAPQRPAEQPNNGGGPYYIFGDHSQQGTGAGGISPSEGGDQMGGFDGLGGSLTTVGWLPGLD